MAGPIRRNAFTLIELMVSMAIVVLLILAVNQIFSTAMVTVRAGNSTLEATRAVRSVQAVITVDLSDANRDAPFFLIRSSRLFAFQNRGEQQKDRDNNPGTDETNLSGNSQPVPVPVSRYDERNHRIDQLAFFAFAPYTSVYDPDITSNEGFIWLGHLRSANNTNPPQYYDPGAGDANANPNNFYARDWTLGRVALLLKDPRLIQGNAKVYQRYLMQHPNVSLSPLAGNSPVIEFQPKNGLTASGTPCRLTDSVADVAAVTAQQFEQQYDPRAPLSGIRGAETQVNATWGQEWWRPLIFRYAYHSNPMLELTPGLTRHPPASRAWPYMARGISQFMVEFAGDYFTQEYAGGTDLDNDNAVTPGKIVAVRPDGRVDFIARQSSTGRLIEEPRWYGLPRDTNGDGFIRWVDGDVAPVRDLMTVFTGANNWAAFERELPPYQTTYEAVPAGNVPRFNYTCLWRRSAPAMLRIVLVLADDSGMSPSGAGAPVQTSAHVGR